MTAYRFTYPYSKFYPDVKSADGRSLTAEPGDVLEFEVPPGDGCWLPVEDVQPPAEQPFTPSGESVEAPAAVPAPDVPVQAAGPAQVTTEPPAAAPAQVPVPPAPAPWTFPGFGSGMSVNQPSA